MIHTAGSPIHHNMVESGLLWYNECLVLDALSRWSVPIFVMLTGFFMINPQKDISIKSLLSKNILRIFVALCFWSLFYAFTLNKQMLPLGSQEGHFWYLGMVIGLYLSLPILRIIAQYRKVLQYFIVVCFFLMVYKFLGLFIELPIYNLDYSIFADYVGYCLLGYYLKDINYTFKLKTLIYSGGSRIGHQYFIWIVDAKYLFMFW
jgi:surface polysaccharide O-acyltransferase-like enzyme